jgi:staphylococcal nuclease domain-containing protein 1
MERLRAAEKTAKERHACLYANMSSTHATAKVGGTTANGDARTFEATVVRIWSGDQISVVERDGGKERRIQFSSTRGPK